MESIKDNITAPLVALRESVPSQLHFAFISKSQAPLFARKKRCGLYEKKGSGAKGSAPACQTKPLGSLPFSEPMTDSTSQHAIGLEESFRLFWHKTTSKVWT